MQPISIMTEDQRSEPTSLPQLGLADLANKCDEADESHTQYTCPKCYERLNQQFDSILRSVMIQEGWPEDEVNAVSLRQFEKQSMTELAPDRTAPEEVRRRVFASNCVSELQARIDTTRDIHEARMKKSHAAIEES